MSIRGEYWWVHLHANGINWARCFTGETIPRQQGSCAEIVAIPAPAGARLVLCVPGDRARIHKVSLPVRNRKRFLQALPFALEDQLLHEPASYHLVPLQTDRGVQDVPVVVIEHAYLRGLLEQYKQSGWQVSMLVPDYLAIPAPDPGVWLIDASTPPLLLRMPGRQGAVLAGGPGTQTIGTLLLALEQANPPPQLLRVRVADHQQYKTVSAWSDALTSRNIQLDIFLDERPRSAWLACQPLPDPGTNLLAGPYANRDRQGLNLHRLLPATVMLAVLIVISAIHWLVNGAKLQSEHLQLQQSIEATYRQAFPAAKNLVDPRFQMEQEIKSLVENSQSGNNRLDLLARLELLSGVLVANPDAQLQMINFDGSSITLEVSVADYESLELLQGQLAQFTSVDIENAELKDGRVYGRIRLGGQV